MSSLAESLCFPFQVQQEHNESNALLCHLSPVMKSSALFKRFLCLGLSQTVGTGPGPWSQHEATFRKLLPRKDAQHREEGVQGGNEPGPCSGDMAGWAAEGNFRVLLSPTEGGPGVPALMVSLFLSYS